ncbi:xylulose kinase [Mycolicibacterium moriokaense]|uniref:Xylulose kinase n=1 Tax=Mycolicibacterium moriokaense TaxID=39691 RepID=A0AAD1HC20_9MYCO|nr:FGGY family carbohydrate kinase [Mycolicibacterium moriokaense]MCV7038292.1 xylulose kinase [Mycolicibacterium moriokaense]ORB24275.1 xylulose kinase [Mycolicibacterium moriokaense]BBX02590.1 xylulokinase [Mycolicibacterium moriokaense]
MALVAGIDSSTQSCKVAICDADTGSIVRSATAPHPDGTEIDPQRWWSALQTAIKAAGGLDDVAAMSVGAQQHGMVCLDRAGAVVRDALLWNDTRSSVAADALVSELGADEWAKRVGVVPVAAITAAKLRWLADHEPAHADATAAVCLPHDWLTWRLGGSDDIADLRTDRSDASGTGYFSSESGSYHLDLLEMAMRGRRPQVPTVLEPSQEAGRTSTGAVLGPGAGDNAGAALGLGAEPGDCIISLGTSGVVSAVGDVAPHDPEGIVAGFADATGRQLSLVCTLNGAPVLAAAASMLGVDFDELDRLALSAPAGADGLTLVPYFAGERSPNLPQAAGALHGMTGRNLSAANVARATVEGLLSAMAYCIDRINAHGVNVNRIILVGGGARSEAVRRIAPALLGKPVHVPASAEYVALGAARQAAWTLSQADSPPAWSFGDTVTYTADPTPHVLERYQAAQPLTLGQ